MVGFGGAAGLSSPRVEKHVGSPVKEAPIPILIAQTCLPSPLRLRVHTTGELQRGGDDEEGTSVDYARGGRQVEADEGMRLTSRGCDRKTCLGICFRYNKGSCDVEINRCVIL